MKPKLMGIKQGMTQLFDAQGNRVVCTVIKADKHVISQIKTVETDKYSALQLCSGRMNAAKARKVAKPQQGHYKKAGIEPRKKMSEVRVDDTAAYTVGQELGVELFQDIAYVDIIGVSKGKGYQGVMKRHNYAGGPAAHGSGFHRHAGSTGMRSTPGRCLPGGKKAGRMGGERVTVESLRVVKIDTERQVIIVEGAIPGFCGGLVYITTAKKKMNKKKK
ncbi:MAG: 50S ribosomal protein L3 [Rhabdochlamydiaceae bacterium]|nr:50S ribosomal protein L3 [Rhabdochlamydiaceae bacterium]